MIFDASSFGAVVFDLDDTLIDQTTASDRAVAAWAEELGRRPVDPRAWERLSNRHYRRYMAGETDFEGQRRDRTREIFGLVLDDAAADAMFSGYNRLFDEELAAFDDARDCLDRARAAGLRVGLLTNGERDRQLAKVRRFGFEPLFDAVVASSELPAGKPDRRAFEAVLSLLGVPADRALMVGDDVENDAEGGMNAGLAAVVMDPCGLYPDLPYPRVAALGEIRF
ncbi:HAD family hydrolase [Microbacterium indicum]|uniref:HAD family hydrolase n=1 Tax=Microbacterium indicum TaxID=358100 RepID=UPI0003F813D2|nr:HAD family hydrolase [Microbacterium indicum]